MAPPSISRRKGKRAEGVKIIPFLVAVYVVAFLLMVCAFYWYGIRPYSD